MNVGTVVQSILMLVQRVINGKTVLTFMSSHREHLHRLLLRLVRVADYADNCPLARRGHRARACRWVRARRCSRRTALTSDGNPYVIQGYGRNRPELQPTALEPMPLQTVRWPAGSNLAHKKRIVAIRAKLRLTQGLYANGNLLQQTQLDNFQMDAARCRCTRNCGNGRKH